MLDSRRYESTSNDPQGQPAEYEEMLDSRRYESTSNDPQGQPAEYEEMLDSRRYESTSNDPQEQPAEYEEMLDSRRYDSDYSDNIPVKPEAPGDTSFDADHDEYNGQVNVFDYEEITNA